MRITNYLSENRANRLRMRRTFGHSLLASAILALSTGNAGADTGFPEFSNGLVAFSDDIPEVLTTTRLRQPKTRVPGSTTVITGDMIRDLGIQNLYEVFRLVPGMVVNFVGSHQPVTTYHGTVHYEQRRMQVLVDGRTAHKATLSDMDWETMPVPLEMIERIEVARGPTRLPTALMPSWAPSILLRGTRPIPQALRREWFGAPGVTYVPLVPWATPTQIWIGD